MSERRVDTPDSDDAHLELIPDLRARQSNVLPPDIIANERHMNDVLWNGPKGRSWVERMGVIGLGLVYVLAATAFFSEIFGSGCWPALVIPMAFIYAGGRMMYKGVVRRPPAPLTDDPEVEL